jgi:pimeloyl-ACP methyl ester carboxylesterase
VSRELHVTTVDGRLLEGVVTGPDDGELLVYHHGTPGAGVVLPALADAASDRGLRTLFYSRPGYGASTPRSGRQVGAAELDTSLLLHVLGVDKFWTLGWSGGGPHALACAALLPERCLGAGVVAGVAPYDARDGGLADAWTTGMGEANIEEFAAAAAGAEALEQLLAGFDRDEVTHEAVLADFETLLPPVDVGAFTGSFADYLVEVMRHAMSRGTAGWRDDDLAFLSPWGFDVAAIEVPVLLAQGDQDLMVPVQHGEWLAARLPRAEVVRAAGAGHLSLMSDPGPLLDRLLALRT